VPGNDPLIRIRDLSFRYPESFSGRNATSLRHISLSFGTGEFVVITGPSGSGKSTLARCFNGLIPHATEGTMEGDVIVSGMSTRDHDVADFARLVGMVFQDPGYQLVTNDVESELSFGLEVQNLPGEEIRSRIIETAELLHIGHLIGRETSDLSWGERQRVAIASVLAVRPRILVLDEPFSGIDSAAGRSLAGLLDGLRTRTGTTVIVFEHRTTGLLGLADRLIVLQDGSVLSDGKPEGVVARHAGYGLEPAGTSPPPGNVREPAVVLRDLVYRYPGKSEPVLPGTSLTLWYGEVAVMTGPNGAGKTTILKHCNGLLRPDSGSVLLGKTGLGTTTVAAAAKTVGLLNQHADLQLFGGTIEEELAFGPRNLGVGGDRIGTVVDKTRLLCSLSHIARSAPPLGLSGGEKQRVALAGIVAMETPVIVLDEPTFGMDPGLKRSLASLLRALAGDGKAVIVATHDEEFGEACGDRFIRISGGRVESDARRKTRPAAGHGAYTEGEDPGGSG